MIRSAAASFALLLAAPASAQDADIVFDPAPVRACLDGTPSGERAPACLGQTANACQMATPDGSTTIGIGTCIARETEEWDRFLNEIYADLRQAFDVRDAEDGPSGPAIDRSDALRDAQRAWIAFRDADCTMRYALWQGGTIRSIVGAFCRRDLTARRVLELRDLRDDPMGG